MIGLGLLDAAFLDMGKNNLNIIPPLVCKKWITILDNYSLNANETTTADTYTSQKLQITSSVTVCSVDQIFYNAAGDSITIEFWSGPNRTGAQIGTPSISSTDTGAPGGFDVVSFTWAVNPVISTDCYMTYIYNVPPFFATNVGSNTTDPYLPGLGYDAYIGSTQSVGHDLLFNLWMMQ